MRVGQQIGSTDFDAIPEMPTLIDDFPGQSVTIDGQIHDVVHMHITADFAGDHRKLIMRLRTVNHIVASNRIDSQQRFRVQIHRQIMRGFSSLLVASTVYSNYLRKNMRIFHQIARQHIQLIAQRIIVLREFLDSCVVVVTIDGNDHFIAHVHIARNGTHYLSGVFCGLGAVNHIVARHGINGYPSPSVVINMYLLRRGLDNFVPHRIV